MVEEKLDSEKSQAHSIENDVNSEGSLKSSSLEDEWIDILGNGQLRKRVIKAGIPNSRPSRGDACKINAIGKLDDGTIVEQHEELSFQQGDVEVIQGLDLAVALMDVDEEAEIEIASRFAYGSIGEKPNIPSNVTLRYNVKLISVELEAEFESLTVNERKRIGNKKRERGNWWFTRNEPALAMQCYRRALDFLSPAKSETSFSEDGVEETESDADLQALLEDRLTVYNNLAQAQLKTQAYEAALKSVENVLSCQPRNIKALFRKGKILHLKGEHSQAYLTLSQAQKLDPQNKAIQHELSIIKGKSEKDVQKEKNMYRKMLGTKQETSINKSLKNEGKIKSSFIAWSLIGGTIVATVGVIAYKFIS
ncbi:peptidyl-prolyl cis-trans isomerase FKBP8 [Leptopilina heterotoma]|uniref:peptidyl-prolyl cis-trans isomerase FKBP8 n=1 Tax=Leptopilina heterotoma TaxID=63436 RepID=UPI001CA9B012|nr:peptidyl-prolyl cis-trans isomerase FKBP8 [Leptopilina heterotoma]XP_043483887.1 peptidyl-prolyl cis-trans isomerase FKBP8 [Leptopilina heterotoma]